MEEYLIQARVIGNRVSTYINKPVFSLTNIPMYFDEGFLLEHRYSITNFGFLVYLELMVGCLGRVM